MEPNMNNKFDGVLNTLKKASADINSLDVGQRKTIAMQRKLLPVIAELESMRVKELTYAEFNRQHDNEVIEA
jgi:hypothetical protein